MERRSSKSLPGICSSGRQRATWQNHQCHVIALLVFTLILADGFAQSAAIDMRATGLVATSLVGIVLRRDRVTDHPQQPPPPQRQALWPADLIEDTVRHDHQIVIVGQGDGACLESGNSVLLLKEFAGANFLSPV